MFSHLGENLLFGPKFCSPIWENSPIWEKFSQVELAPLLVIVWLLTSGFAQLTLPPAPLKKKNGGAENVLIIRREQVSAVSHRVRAEAWRNKAHTRTHHQWCQFYSFSPVAPLDVVANLAASSAYFPLIWLICSSGSLRGSVHSKRSGPRGTNNWVLIIMHVKNWLVKSDLKKKKFCQQKSDIPSSSSSMPDLPEGSASGSGVKSASAKKADRMNRLKNLHLRRVSKPNYLSSMMVNFFATSFIIDPCKYACHNLFFLPENATSC